MSPARPACIRTIQRAVSLRRRSAPTRAGPACSGRPTPTAPTPITFSSPVTGQGEDGHPYQQVAFEADLPRITAVNVTDYDCSRNTGTRWTKDSVTGTWTNTGEPCAVPPKNDTATTAFYPTFGQSVSSGKCAWQFGNYSASTGGAGVQFGHDLFKLAYLVFGGGGALTYRFNDVRHFGPSGCGVSAAGGGDDSNSG